MLTAEGVLLVFLYLQPPFVGLLLFVLGYRRLILSTNFSVIGLLRQRKAGVRVFECAVAGRLGVGGSGAQGGLEGPYQAFIALFLLYDLDFLFFLSEATFYHHWSGPQATLALLYSFLFILGAWVDNNIYSPTWTYLP
jgi:hypothetical protein